MLPLNSFEIAKRIGATAVGAGAEAATVVADSRSVTSLSAFAAVRGGHAFVAEALASGAPFVIVDDATSVPEGARAIVVDDVVAALGRIARLVRQRSHYAVVGITGSTGKTLTKDLVAAALGAKLRVHATPRSYNAELGVPLTVLGCPPDTDVLVAELAARRPGEIAPLAEIVAPRTGVITGIGTAHVDIFGSREAIAATKCELLAALPASGLGVVPSNDDFLDVMSSSTAARLVTVGPGGGTRYRAHRIDGDGRTFGEVVVGTERIPVVIGVPGRALMRNAAFAIRVANEHGIDATEAAAAIADATLSSWRLEISTVGDRTIINDAWNSNPTSVASALHSARELAGDREVWAVLGEMAELGPRTEAEHYRIGRLAVSLGYTGVIVPGAVAARIADGASPIAHRVGSLDEAAEAVMRLTGQQAVVIVKASRVAGLERLVEMLAAVRSVDRSP